MGVGDISASLRFADVSRDADQSALEVREMADDEAIWRCDRAHHTSSPQALSPRKRGFDIRNANVEDSVAVIALAPRMPPRMPVPSPAVTSSINL